MASEELCDCTRLFVNERFLVLRISADTNACDRDLNIVANKAGNNATVGP